MEAELQEPEEHDDEGFDPEHCIACTVKWIAMTRRMCDVLEKRIDSQHLDITD
jgi:hypothetical protein